jgi:CheY-like chemotaxis protein
MTALRVLYVDDDNDIREVVGASLGLDSSFVTRSCSSGQEALALAAGWTPDIVLLDVMMPVMDGPSTLARLRANPRTAGIPVVFMTARAQSREIDLFCSLGAVGVIPKPFDPMTLAASVRSYVERADGRLAALQKSFRRRLNEDTAKLAEHRSALNNAATAQATLAGIRDIAHDLAGASGIFGFGEISDAAAGLEAAIILELDGSGSIQDIACALDGLIAHIQASGTDPRVPKSFKLDA